MVLSRRQSERGLALIGNSHPTVLLRLVEKPPLSALSDTSQFGTNTDSDARPFTTLHEPELERHLALLSWTSISEMRFLKRVDTQRLHVLAV
ncbi:MAG: hypothetical protein J07HQX50_00202 [Haloquadratum sp. J07HQX50]|nr:MAG: hypothetical protein J07HQX50_00202 [Haloquadratum sp. J07HQX50]